MRDVMVNDLRESKLPSELAAVAPRPQKRRLRSRPYDVVFYAPYIGFNLAHRASAPAGGAENQVLMLAQALSRRGWRVAAVAFGRSDELPSEVNGVAIVPRPQYMKRHRLPRMVGEVIRTWHSLWKAPSRAIVYRTAGIELGLIAPFARLTRRRLVFATANVVDFDIAKLMVGRPFIRKHRDLLLYKLGVRLADAIVVQTEEQARLCKTAFSRRPVMIKSLQPLAERQQQPPEAFMWVGRLVSYKRPLEYVALARALPEAKFWMIGVSLPHLDEDRLVAEKVILAAEKVPNLRLLAPRPHTEVGALLSRAVAAVNTSEFEGMPNVLLEAWSRGVPALVLKHDPGGVVATHGLGGFASGSLEKLVELARAQWLERNHRPQLAARCRNYIETHHSPDLIAEQWAHVIRDTPPRAIETSAPEAEAPCAA